MLGSCDRDGMRHRACNEFGELGMGDQRARLVEDHDGAVLVPAAAPGRNR